MKTILISLVCLLFSFSALSKQVSLDTKSSKIEWLGQKKVPGGDHKGTINIKSGTVNLDQKQQLVGGTIIIDMTSINDTDLTGDWKKKLEAHLNSADFFDTANHKEATFKITKVMPGKKNSYKVTGNLTLRGKTNTETFDIMVTKKGKAMMASGTITFDRNKYGVTYNSEQSVLKKLISIGKDKVIKDQIQITLNLMTGAI